MKKVTSIILIVLSILGLWVFKLIWDAGEFKELTPHFSGSCKEVEGVVGAEDITIHPLKGIAYISAYDRRAGESGKSAVGGIYSYDLNDKNAVPRLLSDQLFEDFQPHGLSLFFSDASPDLLFVINHGQGRHSVEILEVEENRLNHLQTVTGKLLASPNDILAVGTRQFYLTNDHKRGKGIGRALEEYLKLAQSNIVYFDGDNLALASSGFGFANGINMNQSGDTLFLSTTIDQILYVFDRNAETGALKKVDSVYIGSGLDNIEVDENGGIWVASHPKLFTFLRHAKNSDIISPSQIFKVIYTAQKRSSFEEKYLNHGEEISAASAAAVRNGRMLVGSVFDDKILDCRL